jgi:LPS O-antigen subunit length determinant protein (WzzB/FepE family)
VALRDQRAVNESELHRNLRDVMQGTPSGYFLVVPSGQDEEVIDLATLFVVMGRSWKQLLGATLLAAAVAAGVSFLMPPTYQVKVLLAPVSQGAHGSLGALREQLGGLAALAGVDVGEAGGRKEESVATLASMGFARDFIVSEKLLPVLFADKWDPQAAQWRSGEKVPTLEQGVKKFVDHVRDISEDRKSGLVSMTVEWRDPELSARWANQMVDKVNERLRSNAIRSAERNLEYLNKELAKTNVVELRHAINRLIEEQVNNAMLANVQHEYAFRVIDPAVRPESRTSPKRTVMTIVGAVLGLIVGLVVILLRHRLRRAR